uniref:Uncharacterized protein n=1 Tax=Arundo donax TaxID=35708 RepID=A0A0A9A752_ARUDO
MLLRETFAIFHHNFFKGTEPPIRVQSNQGRKKKIFQII